MEFKILPKDIFSIIRTYIHPYEIEMLTFPTYKAEAWAVEQHWYIGIIHILQTSSYAKTAIDAIIASNDETMVLILWEHRDLWQQWDYLSLMNVVTILTTYHHEITECDYLSAAHLNGASRIGNLALMRQISTGRVLNYYAYVANYDTASSHAFIGSCFQIYSNWSRNVATKLGSDIICINRDTRYRYRL